MPPKKKGSAKLPRTTSQLLRVDEERKKLLEQEKLRRRNKFEMEEKAAKLNMFKIQNSWKDIMKEAKSQALRGQLTLLQQLHERHGDRQADMLAQAGNTLAEADAQYETILQSHLDNIDKLTELQSNRLDALKQQFDTDLRDLELEFGVERADIQTKDLKDRSDILGIITRVDRGYQEIQIDTQHEFRSVRDDVKNKNLEEKHALRIQLEGTIEELWKQFQTALTNYNAATEDRKKSFEELKSRDEESAHVIEEQLHKLSKLSEKIASFKARLGGTARDADGKLGTLRSAKEEVSRSFQALKKCMNAYQNEEKKKLVELTRVSGRCMKDLKAKVELAEKMVKLSEMNAKFETEEERIIFSSLGNDVSEAAEGYEENEQLSFDMSGMQLVNTTSNNMQQRHDVKEQDQLQPASSGPRLDSSKVLAPLSNYYKRYNKVLLDKLALETTKANLEAENQSLLSLLKSYLDGISVNEEVIESENPLFVVNGRTNVKLMGNDQAKQRAMPFIEASHAVRNMAM